MSITDVFSLFHVDILSIVMISLVSFMGTIVGIFSKNYMKGDALYYRFFLNIFLLIFSVIFMTISDNILIFLISWVCCNILMTQLMIHKATWKAAKASGTLAFRNFTLGFVFIVLAFFLLYRATGSFSIQYIVHHSNDSFYEIAALGMLLMSAMTQSAIWPFHLWLTSSLNSPTPVSAIMHAGIVNGGGFLLVRFAPLYFSTPKILDVIFIAGLVSALLGSVWKLMQYDVKRMLACSTMGQMGFMLVQCGLGLFGAALAHLCWHGMFKAYLFLASGGSAQETRLDLGYPPNLVCFFCALLCGAWGSYVFSIINHHQWLPLDTTLIPVGIVFITGAQLALMILRSRPIKRFLLGMTLTTVVAVLYGTNVYVFDLILSPLRLMQPNPLHPFHISLLIIMTLSWGFILFVRYSNTQSELPCWVLNIYVKMLNTSQPHPSTVTTHHNGYDLGRI
ncbi:proton-conducting transporter membrane subunit [Holospora curviuscula]|uniref:NADH-quinone oxidoreductase subunit L n=1 Tax=Holospora curviuscula TaxID=1082868 RepID=A0A2S5R8S7_9PROT|nr:proton-conducting transporter membrane subunit [Holospora curviuscula]PPE03693.1 NADH-quinone oxidoreductase subunit L [Holospora curviuscula]